MQVVCGPHFEKHHIRPVQQRRSELIKHRCLVVFTRICRPVIFIYFSFRKNFQPKYVIFALWLFFSISSEATLSTMELSLRPVRAFSFKIYSVLSYNDMIDIVYLHDIMYYRQTTQVFKNFQILTRMPYDKVDYI